MNKHIIVFCEGDHDIAFLSRILFVNGFEPYQKKVSEFEIPLKNLYQNNLKQSYKIEDAEFKFQRPKREIPFTVLVKKDILIVFHNLDGDGNICKGEAMKIMNMYLDLNKENQRDIQGYDKLNYRFLFFMDSDEIGVNTRIKKLKDILQIETLESHSIKTKDDYEVGTYIFHNDSHPNKNGKLEDTLLALMKKDNQEIFKASEDYLNNFKLNEERQKKMKMISGNEQYYGNSQFKHDKSIISVAGQLQFSGANNSVIIAASDFIKKVDIDSCNHCKNILQLFL